MTQRFSKLVELFRQNIEDEISGISSSIANGACTDFASYKEQSGRVQGLKLSLQTLEKTIKEIEHGSTDPVDRNVDKPDRRDPYD